jgi:hypothetical protein
MPRKPISLPPLEILRKMFRCDLNTGILYNRVSRTSRRFGARADTGCRRGGYRIVFVDGRHYSAHRVVWALAHGTEPPAILDHINGDPTDNRPSNLRKAEHGQNLWNRSTPKHSTSGAKGVHRRKDTGKWRAYISVDRKRTWLGTFETFAEADAEARSARQKNHGNFARS